MTRIIIDPEKCVCCGDCARICPVLVYGRARPPCQIACPLHTDVQGYLSLIMQGKFSEAFEVLAEVNPLPNTCGRVCTRPCEKECERAQIDEVLAICSLKRFVTESIQGEWKQPPLKEGRRVKTAVVGAGPAGLAAAFDLAMLGYDTTVFEALPRAGGMLYTAIPEYRLPRHVLQADIDHIRALGVVIQTDTRIGERLTVEHLFQKGYRAILLAIGVQKGLKLEIPGESAYDGVVDGLNFLRDVNLGKGDYAGKRVIVIGGGHTAIDSARSAIRLGCSEVGILYRRSRDEMPAIPSEVEEAECEGIRIHYQSVPVRIFGENERVVGLECLRTALGEPDRDGRRQALPIKGTEFRLDADLIVAAIGQIPDFSVLPANWGDEVSSQMTLAVDLDTMATRRDGIFAAGDVVTGSTSVVEAIASGKKAAWSMHRYLTGERIESERPAERGRRVQRGFWKDVPRRGRIAMAKLSKDQRVSTFGEVALGYSKDEALREAQRCLACGFMDSLDLESCCGSSCRICMDSCWQGAITVFDEKVE